MHGPEGIELREELAQDTAAIYSITQAAFAGKPYAAGDEAEVIDRLRTRHELSLSLVAIDGGSVVGQATFSPVLADDGSEPWFALGPIAVTPDRQSEGIGGLLIRSGLARLKDNGALGCMLTGNPAYYQRFGFEFAPVQVPPTEPAEYFMLHWFTNYRPRGRLHFSPAFYA